MIDKETVWYGSVNLLSKEDAEDNLMRVCSKEIADQLLEMTFGKRGSFMIDVMQVADRADMIINSYADTILKQKLESPEIRS